MPREVEHADVGGLLERERAAVVSHALPFHEQVDQLSQDLRRGHFATKLIAIDQVFQRVLPRTTRPTVSSGLPACTLRPGR